MRSLKSRRSNCISLTVGIALAAVCGMPANADDTEVFFGNPTSTSAPNIMLILDTSGSMEQLVPGTPIPYDPLFDYPDIGNCVSGRIFFKQGSGTITPPGCSSNNYVSTIDFNCSAGMGAINGSPGYYQDAGIRWTRTSASSFWSGTTTTYNWSNSLTAQDYTVWFTTYDLTGYEVACQSNVSTSYPNNVNPTSTTGWTTTAAASYWATGGTVTQHFFYSANYLNWYNGPRLSASVSRMSVVKAAAIDLLNSLSGVNVGLMRYDTEGEGGMVVEPVQPVETGKANMIAAINSWNAAGSTPLSETLYESYLYFSGGAVDYGDTSEVCTVSHVNGSGNGDCDTDEDFPSVTSSRVVGDTGNYATPMQYSCQKNYVVYLTDGLPTSDTSSNSDIDALVTGTCSGDGGCLDELTNYMYTTDLRPGTTVTGTQNVTSYFIGFGNDVNNGTAFTYLQDAAVDGGGQAYPAGSSDELTGVLNTIFAGIRNDSTTFTSPTVAVNSFNKTQVLEDMYVSVFQPTSKYHWPGNLKKYKLRNSRVISQTSSTTSAVDTNTGFFYDTARSYWSTVTDGKTTTLGGAANLIPAYTSGVRKVYTYIGADPAVGTTPNLATGGNNYLVDAANTLIDDTLLAIGGTGDPTEADLIAWTRGKDVTDEDGDSNTTENRNAMGDPVHSQPAVVIYGQVGATQAEQMLDSVVFVATNDGYLHAVSTQTGIELWSFIPQEMLPNLKTSFQDPATTTKHYALDGNIRVLKYDINGDGIVNGNDKVILYVSQGRGGSNYYALDITNKTQPKYMWTLTSSELSGIGQSWSTPTLGRVKISDGSGQNSQYFVLIFGGGYDAVEENVSFVAANSVGRAIFMVDAVKGTVLWHAGPTSSGAELELGRMTHSIPSEVTVIDTNSDGYSDRMYVGDMAGQLWRFDITNGNVAGSLVAGGVIASFGNYGASTPTDANNRRFYNQPDVSLFHVRGSGSFYNIAIGSGYRGHPKNTGTQDRFYSIRDNSPLTPLNQAAYDSYSIITDSDSQLADIGTPLYDTSGSATAVAPGTKGWKLPLSSPSWQGEKVLSSSVTSDGTVLFTTFIPTATSAVTSNCVPSTGSARAYSINILTGRKYFTQPFETYATNGLPSKVQLLKTNLLYTGDGVNGVTPGTTPTPPAPGGQCLSGVTILGRCVDFGDRVKTFWEEAGAH